MDPLDLIHLIAIMKVIQSLAIEILIKNDTELRLVSSIHATSNALILAEND